jgi:hypothetical protein
MVKPHHLLFFFLLLSFNTQAQDSIPDKKDKWVDYEHKPKRSALWSLIPGGGQIYNEVGYRRIPGKKNRAWWKAPIIWGGLGTVGYYYWLNLSESLRIKEEVLYRRDNPGLFLYPEYLIYQQEDVLTGGNGGDFLGFNGYARRRDIFLFASIAVYGLSIVEAFVDGHFVTFDVSEDLSFSCTPTMLDPRTPGINLRLNFN